MEKIPSVAVIIPCYNEAAAIKLVVESFQQYLPDAAIHVFDNASTDDTEKIAKKVGAIVHHVSQKGKGNVVQAMFRDVDADYFIMTDGDGTYPAQQAPSMLSLMLDNKADMIVGSRLSSYSESGSPSGHLAGNKILTKIVNYLFYAEFKDLLSGYRVLSRRFVKSTPLFTKGFEVETAISIHAVEVGAKVLEVPIEYSERVEGTESKLNTFKDGTKIGWTIIRLFKDHKPILIYGFFSALFALCGIIIGTPVILEFFETGLVPRFPSAILASGLMILSSLSLFTGIILSSISKSRKEIKKLAFLTLK